MEHARASIQIAFRYATLVSSIFATVLCIELDRGARAAQQSGYDLAKRLSDNVVQVTSNWGDKSQDGFGFIFGERNGLIYIATANHVVRSGLPDEIDLTPSVTFFRSQGVSYKGVLLKTSSSIVDLAVITVDASKLGSLAWNKEVIAATSKVTANTSVWFVGLDRRWEVLQKAGTVSSTPDVNRIGYSGSVIAVNGLGVNVGSSGAPLVSADGVVGMIVADSTRQDVEAIPIERVRSSILDWQQPWQLTVIEPKQDCDRLAASPYDLNRAQGSGVDAGNLNIKGVMSACFFPAFKYTDKIPRFAFQMGRALEADNRLEAARLAYEDAAQRSYPAAQSSLGRLYELMGRDEDAADLYRRSAEQNDPVGQTNLAHMYRDEYGGVANNDQAAVRLYREAASKGYPPALAALGWMYEQGRVDSSPNEAEARRLHELSSRNI